MLHVMNGDATFYALRSLRLSGRALVWRDALLDGPVPNGLKSDADWFARAKWMGKHAGADVPAYFAGAREFSRDFAVSANDDEVVFWFEEDLFCQLPLCYLLAAKPPGAKWSVICPDASLGATSPDRLAVAFDERREATADLVALATTAWAAYSSSDPRSLAHLVERGDFSAWPLLKRGLLAHLARFPSTANGLGAIEQTVLEGLREGPSTFTAAFSRLGWAPYGLGDFQLAVLLLDLPDLVEIGGEGDPEQCASWALTLTTKGRDVVDARARHARERWLGGVHLRNNEWLWDGSTLIPSG